MQTDRGRDGLGRRDLLKGGVAVGLVAEGLLRTPRARAATPRQGGTLKVGYASSPRTLDPAFAIQTDERMLTQAIFDNLTRLDETLRPQPQLATSWKVEERGLVWTFTLRPGVVFHHGRKLTAADVIYSFERILDPKTAAPVRSFVGPIEKVEAADERTVRFKLASPFVDFPVALGTFGHIVPADRGDTLKTDPSGTGPFRIAEFRPGDRTRLTRHKDYWEAGVPYLDELWQVSLPQPTTQVAALRAGEIHLLAEVPTASRSMIERDPLVSIVEVKSPEYQQITMLANQKPFDDNRVRLAFKHLLDRPALVRAVWQGHARIASDNPVPDISPFWTEIPPRTYDVARAKALLAEAGHGGGLNLELWTTNERPGLQELAVAFREMAAPAGVKIEIKTVPWAVFVSTVWIKKPLYCDRYVGKATIDETLYPHFRTGASWNPSYSNPQVDRLLDEGRMQTDAAKRRELYAQVQRLIADDGHVGIPYHTNYTVALRREVKGYVVHPLRHNEFRWTSLEA